MEGSWLVWSNEHRGWWKPGSFGYTTRIEKAGRYTRAEAAKIVLRAETVPHDPPNEVMVLAPPLDDIKAELVPDDADNAMLHALRMERCPACGTFPLTPGPRGGIAQNLLCAHCGGKWNVGPARFIMFAEQIE